ncbi:MAG: 5-formyltetrahydrofolate cyclo-ligase [Candidatus Margulisiibacteriota bacterium]
MKTVLRNRILTERRALSSDQIYSLSQAIFARLKGYLHNKSFDSMLIYYPIHHEVDTTIMFDYFWKQNKALFLPGIRGDQLYPIRFTPDSAIKEGPHHIPVPDAPETIFAPILPDVAIIPCLACDQHRYRLGYGKGYYDRFLTKKTLKIGFCYDFQLVDHLPVESHDIQLDVIITEKMLLI